MDRRRFVPSADGLEGRALMSLFGGSTPKSNLNTTIQDLPENFQQKALRIEHLPYYLEQTQPGRPLPADALKQLQVHMTAIAGNLHAPTTKVVNDFNNGLRHIFPYQTVSPANARSLNNAFGSVLNRAGATAEQEANLKADMNAIAKADSQNPDPSFLVANDYSLVLQTALSVGRPIPTPKLPVIDTKDGVRTKSGVAGTTHNPTPSMVGTYTSGASKDGFTNMQILNESDQVVATGVVDKNGKYVATLTVPLPAGISHLRARAVDILGHESSPTPAFMLKYVPKPGTTVATATTTTDATTPLSPAGGPTSLL